MNDRQRNRANAFAENARRSLVIVGEVGGPDYCSGFVAAPPKCGCSFIISQSAFVRGRENRLEVRYCCDNMVLPASVIHEGEIFTLLSTDVHDRSVALCLGGAVTQTRKFVFPPSSKENLFQIPAFVTLETVLAYQTPDMVNFSLSDYIEDSGDYFLIRCPYGEKSSDGSCRLVASPVFSMRGGATGVLVGDSRLGGGGSVIKVAMNASLAKGVIYSLFREAEKTGLFKSRKPIFKKKNRGRARKRARMRGGESTAQTKTVAVNKRRKTVK